MDDAAVREVEPSGEQVAVWTFLIADVRGYTAYTAEHGDEAAAVLARQFAELARDAVNARGGRVIELRGDEALAVFSSTRQALWAAAELQGRFAAAMLEDPSLPLKVGIGLDAGEAVPVEGGFRGAAVNRAARLCNLAAAGDVLVSDVVLHLTGRIAGLTYVERGSAQLKGFDEPVRVYGVVPVPEGEAAAPSDGSASAGHLPAGEQVLPIGGFLGSLPAGRLVARERELHAALGYVADVEKGGGRLVFLAGEPGVGKTRLGQEVTLHLRDRGFAIAAGSCYEAHETSAYLPFLEALTTLYTLAPAPLRSQVPQRWPYLAALLPSENLPVAPSLSRDGAQERLLWSVSGFVQALAATAPVALLLDDLHWADSSSLELLTHLAHQARRERVLILATYRDVEVGRQHPLQRTLHDLERQGLVQRIAVRRLPIEGARALVAATFEQERISDEFADLLYERTEGNPFFLEQVLRDLVERGDLYREDGEWRRKAPADLSVPESIRSAVGQRVGRLSGETQDVLQRASVLGQRIVFDELQGLAGSEEDVLERCLDEAAAAGLVQAQNGEEYAFDHALTRQALYAELSPRKRRRLHRAAGEVLERLPQKRREKRLAELTWHFLQADEQEKGLRYSLQAGDAAEAIYAHADAEMQYRTAVELAEEMEDEPSTALALERLTESLYFSSRFGEQLEAANRAAALYRRLDDLDGEGRVIARTARAHLALESKAEGIERLEDLRRRFDGRPASRAHFAVHEGLVTLYWLSGRQAEAEEASKRALAMARTLGDNGIMARALGRRALVLIAVEGQDREIEEANLEAIRLAESVGDDDTLRLALNNISVMYRDRGDLERTKEFVDRQLVVARRLGSPAAIVQALGVAGMHAFDQGNLAGMRAAAQELLDLAQRTGPTVLSTALVVPGLLMIVDGAEEEGRTYLEYCIDEGKRTGDKALMFSAQRLLAQLDRLAGRPEAARVVYRSLLRLPDLDPQARYPLLVESAATLLEMRTPQSTAEARRALDEVLTSGPAYLSFQSRTLVEALRGWLAAREGREEEAVKLMDESLRAARSRGYVLLEGEILTCYGMALVQLGEVSTGRARLIEAADVLERVGHVMARRYVERFLR